MAQPVILRLGPGSARVRSARRGRPSNEGVSLPAPRSPASCVCAAELAQPKVLVGE